MKINESIINFSSTTSLIERNTSRESIELTKERNNSRGPGRGRANQNSSGDRVSIERKAPMISRNVANVAADIPEDVELEMDLNTRLLRAFFERLTGRKFHLTDPRKITPGNSAGPMPEQSNSPISQTEQSRPRETGLTYTYHHSHYELEKLGFSSTGTILTEDGKKIDFSLTLNMSREFYSEQSGEIQLGGVLKDPLVINYSGNSAQLGDRTFHFDIDADGTLDQIAFLDKGSGFLALDKNQDGKVNDGTELFGATTGNGYQELAQYDKDGNNWIDENEAIFDRLRIWTKNSAGEKQLIALGKAGIGAIYLGHIETPFSMKDQENQLLGQVRATGVAAMESGQMVTMQQLDLVA